MKCGIRAVLVAALLFTLGTAFVGDAPPASAEHGLFAQARCLQIAISPQGDEAWAPATDRHTLRRIRLSDGKILASRKFHDIIHAVDINRDGDLLAIAFGLTHRVILADPKTLEPEAEIPTGKRPRLLEFGFEGTDLCVLCPKDEEIDLIDTSAPAPKVDLVIPMPSKPLAFAHYKDRMAVSVPDLGEVDVYSDPDHVFLKAVPIAPEPEWIARGVTKDYGRPGHMTADHADTPVLLEPFSFGSLQVSPKEVLLTTSRESDLLTIIDSELYDVLGTVSIDNPRMVAGGCAAAPYAFVLHKWNMKVSVVDISYTSPTFLDILYEIDLPEPGETLRVASDGTCYVLGWSRHALYAIKDGQLTKLKLKKNKNQDD